MKSGKRISILFLATIVFSLLLGCSVFGVRKFLEPIPHNGWSKIEGIKPIYKYKYACGTTTFHTRDIWAGGFGFAGPPLIPILPLDPLFPEYRKTKSLYVELHISAESDLLLQEAPQVELTIPSTSKKYTPADVINVDKDPGKIKELGFFGQ